MDTLQLSHDRNIYTTNPYNYSGFTGFFRELFQYDQSDWIDPIKNTLSYYESLLIEKNGDLFLPKGTLLYHGSLHYSDFKNSLELTDTYLVDPLILFQNKYNTYYDPRQSVIKIDEYQSEYNQKLPYKKYKEYYLDDKSPSKMNKGGKKKKQTLKKRKKKSLK